MEKFPIHPHRRRLYEGLIRVIDLVTYATVFFGGVYAAVASPGPLTAELGGYGWLIVLWVGLLLVGGLTGFLGRLTRRWMVEVPATVLSFFGIAIFVVMLIPHLHTSVLTLIGIAIVVVASLVMARRWAELQIFSTDPGDSTFSGRVAQAIRRRTQDFVPRHN